MVMISTKIRYSAVLKTEQLDDLHKFQTLPEPSGSYPYRLNLDHQAKDKLVFHMVGDTGGTGLPDIQEKLARQMAQQCHQVERKIDQPAFLYHLGDIVYHYGEADQYQNQFLSPFEQYPGPIYAIAGNHDTDVNPDCEHYNSLEAFYTTFCNTSQKTIYFGQNINRKSQVQPHAYWTMETPLATIIGLHTNVPKYGCIKKDQKSWFINELRHAAQFQKEKAIIVCMHHAPYSADFNHGSSLPMIDFLDAAFKESGVKPDVVFSGHVHNYQRFSKQYSDGKNLPFVVAGAGGFEELHQLADPYDPAYTVDSACFAQVSLDSYCDDRHGFLKVEIEKNPFNFSIKGSYYVVNEDFRDAAPVLFDSFNIDLTGR